MVYFTGIRKTKHYKENHERDVPMFEVIKIIKENPKNIRKKGTKFVIDDKNVYILFKIKDNTLYIINAKRK